MLHVPAGSSQLLDLARPTYSSREGLLRVSNPFELDNTTQCLPSHSGTSCHKVQDALKLLLVGCYLRLDLSCLSLQTWNKLYLGWGEIKNLPCRLFFNELCSVSGSTWSNMSVVLPLEKLWPWLYCSTPGESNSSICWVNGGTAILPILLFPTSLTSPWLSIQPFSWSFWFTSDWAPFSEQFCDRVFGIAEFTAWLGG